MTEVLQDNTHALTDAERRAANGGWHHLFRRNRVLGHRFEILDRHGLVVANATSRRAYIGLTRHLLDDLIKTYRQTSLLTPQVIAADLDHALDLLPHPHQKVRVHVPTRHGGQCGLRVHADSRAEAISIVESLGLTTVV